MSARTTWFTSPPGEVMRFQLVGGERQPRFHRGDTALDDQPDWYAAQPHAEQREERYRRARHAGLNPGIDERDDHEKDDQKDDRNDQSEHCQNN